MGCYRSTECIRPNVYEFREDKNAYLFILNDKGETVRFNIKKGKEKNAVLDSHKNYLTMFGRGDLFISSNCNKNTDSCSSLNYYEVPESIKGKYKDDRYILAG